MAGPSYLQRSTWATDETHVGDVTAFLVLLLITRHADDSGVAYPLAKTLATKIGRTERTVRTSLDLLENQGYIQRKRIRKDGRLRGYLYRVMIPGCVPVTADRLPPIASDTDIPHHWRRVIPADYKPTAVVDVDDTTNEIIEPAPDEQPDLNLLDDDATDESGVAIELRDATDVEVATSRPELQVVARNAVLDPSPLEPRESLGNLVDASTSGEDDRQQLFDQLTVIAQLPLPDADDQPAFNSMTQQILSYYLFWRAQQGINRPPTKFVGETRNAAKTLLKRGFAPVDVLHAVLSWHDRNAASYAAGRPVANPGAIITAAERIQIDGLAHGINGEGLTARQAAYNAESEILARLQARLQDTA